MNPQTQTDPHAPVADDKNQDNQASFAETALKLGGKSADEAGRMGALDTADDQVDQLFAKKYQTTNSPVHQAIWDRELPVELFGSQPKAAPPEVDRVMQDSLAVMRKHAKAGTNLDEQRKVPQNVLDELGETGYWGLLVDKQHGGSGSPFAAFASFVTQMAIVDPTVAGLAL
jgi:alkylation response protein AidB-like acyl-CoA dehydrogenase